MQRGNNTKSNDTKSKITGSDGAALIVTNNTFDLVRFCRASVPDFNPLGGSRPDAAVLGCAAVSLYTEGLGNDVIVAPDVLDNALAFLCAPIIVTRAQDVFDQRGAFKCHAVSVKLRTAGPDVLKGLRKLTEDASSKLSVVMELNDSTTTLPDGFMRSYQWVTCIDLKRTSLQHVGNDFAADCPKLTRVALPDTVTKVDHSFLRACTQLQVIDLTNTSLQSVGYCFASSCSNLTTVALPDTVTKVDGDFLRECTQLQVIDLRNTSLQSVGYCFANNCPNLTTVALPDTVIQVGTAFLQGSNNVTEVTGSSCVLSAKMRCA